MNIKKAWAAACLGLLVAAPPARAVDVRLRFSAAVEKLRYDNADMGIPGWAEQLKLRTETFANLQFVSQSIGTLKLGYGFEGEILFDGESLKGVPVDERARRGMTLAWQEPARFEGLRVESFIAAGAKDKSRARAREVIEKVGLDPNRYLRRAIDKTLSGGERKRIELASILAMEPRIVLMDEPDSGIDVEALQKIFEALVDLKANGATVILITHSLAVLQQAEHAFLMCSGHLVDKGSVKKICTYFENRCIPCDHENEPSPQEKA